MTDAEASKTDRAIKDLTVKRSSIKGRLTKFKNELGTLQELEVISPLDIIKLRAKMDKFDELFTEFSQVQNEIEVINAPTLEIELCVRDCLEQDFYYCIALAQLLIERSAPNRDNDDESRSSSSRCNHHDDCGPLGFKLPTIRIPNFDGTYFKWLEFRDTFSSLIHKNDKIKDIHKFYYLNSYLEGEAARVVCNLEVTEENYSEAWQLLRERYDNKRQLINNHLRSLLSFESVRETEKSLRFIIDHVTKNLRALRSLGLPTDGWDMIIIYLVVEKLDSKTQFKWEEHKNSLGEILTLEEFFDFLKSRANVIETMSRNRVTSKHSPQTEQSNTRHKTQTKVMTASSSSSKEPSAPPSPLCLCCKGAHRIYDCSAFIAKSSSDRMGLVNTLKLCHNCLRTGHPTRRCRLPRVCKECKQRHNYLLHEALFKAGTDSEGPQGEAVTLSALSSSEVLLCTAEINLINPTNNINMTVRALLDSGSQSSFVTERVRQTLQLTPQPSSISVVGIGEAPLKIIPERCTVRLQSKVSSFNATLSCLILPTISGKIPKASFSIGHLNLQGFRLADPNFNKSSVVDMLIGADLFWDLVGPEQHSLGENSPILRSSRLGWLVAGSMFPRKQPSKMEVHCHLSQNNDMNLRDELTRFWELESVPNKAVLTEEEGLCEQHFLSNTVRESDGRFCVRLPLLADRDCLGDSFRLARKRFLNLEGRFKRQPVLKKLYFDFINEYAELGHLSEYCDDLPHEIKYYLPHHPVIKQTSESTKLRVVFDASARTTSGFSMNDLQMTGPTIQDSLFNILVRFRLHKYILTGDVEKMYRQIRVDDRDRSLQLILWREDESLPLRTLKLNTVTYGFSSASFLSTRCLWQLGDECEDPLVKEIIKKDFYVDDLVTGTQSESELLALRQSIAEALAKGGFHLRKYRSNWPTALQSCLGESSNDSLVLSNSTSTLGIGWLPLEDELYFPIELTSTKSVTKRTILSSTFKVFDPLGILSPCTIKPKMLIQQLWAQPNLGWDDPAPDKLKAEWLQFANGMESISHLKINRHVLIDNPIHIELHCFGDASQRAYGACIYLKSLNAKGGTRVCLLCAKSRVAPIAPTTIPRLELCAALLGAQLTSAVIQALRLEINRQVYWTDSKVVLCWLQTSKNLKPFVANRIGAITELTCRSSWRYVPTSQNPADLVSRGVEPDHLADLPLWWSGPSFLQQDESCWPSFEHCSEAEIPEVKAHPALTGEAVINPFDLSRISKLSIAQRAYARILRLFHNAKKTNQNDKLVGCLQASELERSMNALIKLSQQHSFQTELNMLSQNKPLKTKSNIASLNPFIDSEGLLRVGGRIGTSTYDFDKRHPITSTYKQSFYFPALSAGT